MTPQFGECDPETAYVDRPSAYVVALAADGRVLCVRAKGDLHLPGGGIDPGESPEAAALRELREEAGYEAEIVQLLGEAGQYVPGYFKGGSFFLARVGARVARTCDHEPVWLTRATAAEQLVHESHRWAVRRVETRDDG